MAKGLSADFHGALATVVLVDLILESCSLQQLVLLLDARSSTFELPGLDHDEQYGARKSLAMVLGGNHHQCLGAFDHWAWPILPTVGPGDRMARSAPSRPAPGL